MRYSPSHRARYDQRDSGQSVIPCAGQSSEKRATPTGAADVCGNQARGQSVGHGNRATEEATPRLLTSMV